MERKKTLIVLFVLFCFITTIYSGVVIEQNETSTNFGGSITTITYFSGNNMRTDDIENKASNIFRFGDDEGYKISNKKKTFLKYKISEINKELKAFEKSNQDINKSENVEEPKVDRKIEVVKTDEKKILNNFNVFKVNVFADGKLIEESWFTKDFELNEVKNILDKMKKQNNVQESSLQAGSLNEEEYKISKLTENFGFTIYNKKISTFLDQTIEDIIEVKKIENKNLSNSVFLPPSGYREIVKK